VRQFQIPRVPNAIKAHDLPLRRRAHRESQGLVFDSVGAKRLPLAGSTPRTAHDSDTRYSVIQIIVFLFHNSIFVIHARTIVLYVVNRRLKNYSRVLLLSG